MKIEEGDYVLKEDIPDEDTFNRVKREFGEYGRLIPCFGQWEQRDHPHHKALSIYNGIVVWHYNFSGRRLTLADLGISPAPFTELQNIAEAIDKKALKGDTELFTYSRKIRELAYRMMEES